MLHALSAAARSTPLRRLLLPTAAALVLAAPPAGARPSAGPWDGPAFAADPAALVRAAAALQGAGDGGIDVILLETVYSYDEAGRETYTQRMVYRFTGGEPHESWSAVEQAWAPWHQERPHLRARVVTPDGAEHRLDPATVTESAESPSAADMFEDGRVLRAPLPATGPGAIVEEEVTVRETSPFFDGGTVEFVNFQMAVPVRRVRLVLDAPAGLPLRWTARQLPGIDPAEEIAGGRRRLTFEVRDLAAYEEAEPGLPPEVPRMAYVAFSTGRSWGDLAQRYSEIVDRTIRGADLATFLRDGLRAAGGSSGSQLETVDALLAKMGREIRYTGIELGEGGLLPRTPAETLKRKFGDCKDKAVLLTALLRALDIPAYVALLNAGEGDPDVEESLPGMGAFNHAIVMVPGSPAVWIDPTDPFARAGELPVQDQGRLALVASPTATGLVRTPEATSADNREVETREIYLSDLGGARVVETTDYWGAQEQELRSSYSGADREELHDALEDYVGEAYLAKKLTSLDFSDPKDLSRPFRLRLEAADASRGSTDVRDAAVAIFLSAFAERLPEELTAPPEDGEEDGGTPAPRKNDYVFTRPLQLEQRYRIVPPEGFTPQPLPASRTRQLGPAKVEETYSAGPDGVVTATLRFDSGKRRISPTELTALREGLRQLSEEKPVMITFDQAGESQLAAGRVREALDEFRRLAALSPKKALPRTRIARALLAGGLGEPARQEAEQAVKLEPGLAYAWVTLAWIRQHDDLGRRFGKGYDRAGAIAAYRKAKELDPENKEARADLAILLEHDAEGGRYTPGADLAAAIAEYEPLRDDLEDLGLPNNLLIAYLWAQRFSDMKTLLDRMETSDARASLRLVVLAATEGPDAALRSAERSFADAEARANALSTAGRNLMLLRRYGEAAALFEAAGRQSSNAGVLLGLSELLRKTRRSEEAAFTAKDPTGAVKRLMALVATGKSSPETLSPLLSRVLTRDLPEDQRKAFWEGFSNGLETAARAAKAADVPFQVAMDLGLAVIRESVTGDDALGYRVVMTASMGGNSQRSAAYLVPEEGEYRIAATDKAPTLLGAEALRRLAANDLLGARQWLDWAWEELDGRDASDPMSDAPFLGLWSKGAEADAGDVGQVRCAAASIAPAFQRMEDVLPVLTACRQSATEGPRQTALDRAILEVYQLRESYAEAADAAARLLESHPDSRYLYTTRAASLSLLRRWDDLRRLAEQRLARTPDDSLATDTLADAMLNQGDLDGALQVLQRAVDAGGAGSGTYNEAAWLLLFQGKTDDHTLELAQRAAALSQYKSYPILHTLASVYAEQGKTAEAYRLILQALEVKEGDPDTSDWYVFGRLAEQYGLPDVARRYYEKARGTAGAEPPPASSFHLVRRRLEALGTGPAAPKRVAAGSTRR